MKIVVLDAYAMNPGDLNWDALKQHGETEIYERSSLDETKKRITDADIVLTNKAIVNKELINAAPKLKYIIAITHSDGHNDFYNQCSW